MYETRFNVEIEFMDGRGDVIENVSRAEEKDGVLHLSRHYGSQGMYIDADHLGSFPLANIRSYKRAKREL